MALYEGMFLLDNDLVRAGWAGAKALITDAIAKHGGRVVTARRWDERPLAYGIKRRHRATFLLTYFEMPGGSVSGFQRELEIREGVLRYLQVKAAVVPEGEHALAEAEAAPDFSVPEPPADSPPQVAPELFSVREDYRERRGRTEDAEPADDEETVEVDEDEEEPVGAGARAGRDEDEEG